MKKYSEITLTDNEKKILEWFKGQWFTHVGRTTQYGFVEVFDENNDIKCNLKPMRKPFEFIENGERYEIDKLLNPPHEPKTVWDLEKGDAYWWVASNGYIFRQAWNNAEFEVEYRNQGNVFLTEEEAEFESTRRAVVVKVRKYARPFKYGEKNFTPFWGHIQKRIGMIGVENVQEAQLFFESEEKIKQAIEEIGEEIFKKYYLGVTE